VSFEAPALLLGLLVVPLAAVGYWLVQRRRARYAVRYSNLDVLASVAGTRSTWKRHVPAALLLASLAALDVAFARKLGHDLRGPLNAMVLNLDLLETALKSTGSEEEAEGRRRRYLSALHREIERMSALVTGAVEDVKASRGQ